MTNDLLHPIDQRPKFICIITDTVLPLSLFVCLYVLLPLVGKKSFKNAYNMNKLFANTGEVRATLSWRKQIKLF